MKAHPLSHRRTGHSPRVRGFTLVELMIGITLGLFIMIGLISLLVSNVASRSELDKSSRQIENGRYAVQLLREDLRNAGYFGSSGNVAFTSPAIPLPCPAQITDLSYAAPLPNTVPLALYALTAAPGCINNVAPNTAMLVVSRVDTSAVTPPGAAAETYLQVSNCATDPKPFAIGAGTAGTAVFALKRKDCVTSEFLRKVVQHVYFVSTCDVCTGTGTDTTPTLKMAEYVNGAMTVTPLAEGIENLQFDYGVDTDGDGAPDCYTSNPTSPPAAEIAACSPTYLWTSAAANWTNVMTVRIHVLARNTEASAGWKDTRTYDMGLALGQVGPFNDNYKRHVYSELVRLYNGSGQRE